MPLSTQPAIAGTEMLTGVEAALARGGSATIASSVPRTRIGSRFHPTRRRFMPHHSLAELARPGRDGPAGAGGTGAGVPNWHGVDSSAPMSRLASTLTAGPAGPRSCRVTTWKVLLTAVAQARRRHPRGDRLSDRLGRECQSAASACSAVLCIPTRRRLRARKAGPACTCAAAGASWALVPDGQRRPAPLGCDAGRSDTVRIGLAARPCRLGRRAGGADVEVRVGKLPVQVGPHAD